MSGQLTDTQRAGLVVLAECDADDIWCRYSNRTSPRYSIYHQTADALIAAGLADKQRDSGADYVFITAAGHQLLDGDAHVDSDIGDDYRPGDLIPIDSTAAALMSAGGTKVRLPALQLSAAWLNVAQASTKSDRPALDQTILIETHGPSAVRLVATNGHMLLTSWVATDDQPDPGLDADPDHTIVVTDSDGRAKSLFTWLYSVARKDDEDLEPRTVDLHTRSLGSVDTPTLSPELERQALVIDAEIEQVTLAVVDAPYPTWRSLWPTPSEGCDIDAVSFSPAVLGVFGKLKAVGWRADIEFFGRRSPALVTVPGVPPVVGLIMPIVGPDTEPEAER